MSQLTFEKGSYYGFLTFDTESYYGDQNELEVYFYNFGELLEALKLYHEEKFEELGETEGIKDVSHAELKGISFKGEQDTERFEINMIESFNRATFIFNETKFVAIKNDKLKRIQDILLED